MDILLIDDDADVRQTLRRVLTEAGHAVVEASDGANASALLREALFDVILSDVRLPGAVDGPTWLRTARRDAPLTDIILMTASADVGQAVAALKGGASAYLIKPFDLEELLHHIRRIDTTRSMRRELAEARRTLLLTNGATPAPVRPLLAAIRDFEKVHLRRAVAATGGKRLKAAVMLGISRKSLWEKLRMYDLEEAVGKPAAS